jgi:hypothetical protein
MISDKLKKLNKRANSCGMQYYFYVHNIFSVHTKDKNKNYEQIVLYYIISRVLDDVNFHMLRIL